MKCFVVIASLMVAGARADAKAKPESKAESKPEAEHPVPYGFTPAPPPTYVAPPEPAFGAPVIPAAPEPVAPVAPVAPEPAVHRPVPFTVFSPYFSPKPAEPAPQNQLSTDPSPSQCSHPTSHQNL